MKHARRTLNNKELAKWRQLVDRALLSLNAGQRGGVYSIWSHGEVIYIGSSCNLKSRLQGHDKRGQFLDFEADAVHVMAIEDAKARLKTEEYLIRKHRPMLTQIHLNWPRQPRIDLRPN